MIYLDNAATTKYKPDEVIAAFEYYVREIGVSPGRGSYKIGIEASRMLYQARKNVGLFFGLKPEKNVVFTKNSTEAINLLFHGLLRQGNHVVISCYEHNAVLRPLEHLRREGVIDYSVIVREDLLLSPEEIYKKYCNENTVVFESTLASNITGRVIFREEVFQYMRARGIKTFLDSSQGAGKIAISMDSQGIDYLAFTSHKDLMSLPGAGGLCCKDNKKMIPLIQGGTGIFGDLYVNPNSFPEGLEAGTLDMPAIWSLNVALHLIEKNKSRIYKQDQELRDYMIEKLKSMKNVTVYDADFPGVGTVGFNVVGYSSSDIVKKLDEQDVCVRGGIHCAILAHEALGTVNEGIVRASIGNRSSREDVDCLIKILNECR